MNKSLLLVLAVIVCVSPVPLYAAEKMQVAVLDLKPREVSKIVTGAVSDIIRSEMVKTGLFTVVERAQMNEILKEQGFQMTGCTDQACAVQVGKLLSARKILVGEINRVGKAFMITVRIVDVEKGVSEFAANEKAENEDVLDKAGAGITRKLAQNIVEGNKEYFVERKTRSGYYTRAIVPGWGQFYADRDTKGYVFLGSFALSAGFAVFSYMRYSGAADDYSSVPRGAPQSEFDSKYDAKAKAANLFMIAGGVTALVYAAHWVDFLFFSRPEFGEKTAARGDGGPFRLDVVYSNASGLERIVYGSAGVRF
ncbi:MAG: Curli production assembly/transport component CsgG [Spirochaetes bacterium ADurb.BinA120]|mgnify:FL=1|nr:MAG: Curli production assembly/transport component CsgG [Spirochaetes bacterium ADurb.BinA120]HPV98654.1 CsgG/HfaB family protein [Spirochaetota bacterium]